MPLIRYRIGDVGVLGGEQCSCGRGLPLMESIEGRAVDFITLPNGRALSPRFIMSKLEAVRGSFRYKVFQREKDKVAVVIEDEGLSKDASTRFIDICQELLGEEIEVGIKTQEGVDFQSKYRPVTPMTIKESVEGRGILLLFHYHLMLMPFAIAEFNSLGRRGPQLVS